jgi:hypothetical protein
LLSNPISGLHRPSNPLASPSYPVRLSSDRVLRFCLPTQPPTLHRVLRPPTSPSSQPPTFIGHRPSGSPLRLTSGFHRRRIFGLSLRTRLPTFIGTRILRFCQRLTFELDRSLNPPAVPSISCRLASTLNHSAVPATNFPVSFEDFILRLCLPAGSRLASVTTPPCSPGDQLPTSYGSSVEKDIRSGSPVHASANCVISVDILRQAISSRFRALQILQKCQQMRCFRRRRDRPFPFDKNEKCPKNAAIPRFQTNRFPQGLRVSK